ncbi:hypothetical protein EZV62_014899 [Acer yangbiense]|uniref:DUF4218 domain-containing protein n=1 Tax=Acer yangbiense TaxID=1000413 RepID=A0A5C7HVJ2_9ROSI|nr:hypothetical protein EZV62_014899 [Acer yangbiense]
MSFFDVMEHLLIYLAEEALIAGLVQFWWMHPIERYLPTLKFYVRNRAHLEASIAKGYLMEECTNFCSRYLNDVETKWNRPPRNDGRFNKNKGVRISLDEITWVQAHRFKRYDINGFRFHTKNTEKSRVTQNSDVVLKVDTMSYGSARDRHPRAGTVTFHGGKQNKWYVQDPLESD